MSNYKQNRFDGDVTIRNHVIVGGNTDIAGSITIGHDLRVDGRLISRWVESKDMGLFRSLEELEDAIKRPERGMYAQVILEQEVSSPSEDEDASEDPSVPHFKAEIYICEKSTNGSYGWVSTGYTTGFEVQDSHVMGIYDRFFKPELDSYYEDLKAYIDSETKKLDEEKADIVDLAKVLECACSDADNTKPCDCCKLPTLSAVFIYTQKDGTILVPHQRTIYVKNEKGYKDGYYIIFGITHSTCHITDHDAKYVLFELPTLRLVGQYKDNSRIKAPEWIRYAFSEHEVSESRSGLMTPSLYSDLVKLIKHGTTGGSGLFKDFDPKTGKLTDFMNNLWQLQPYVLKPTITVDDVTHEVYPDVTGSGIVMRVTISSREGDVTDNIVLMYCINDEDETLYEEPFDINGMGTVIIRAWYRNTANGKDYPEEVVEVTTAKMQVALPYELNKVIESNVAEAFDFKRNDEKYDVEVHFETFNVDDDPENIIDRKDLNRLQEIYLNEEDDELGDINFDGKVNTLDMALLSDYLNGDEEVVSKVENLQLTGLYYVTYKLKNPEVFEWEDGGNNDKRYIVKRMTVVALPYSTGTITSNTPADFVLVKGEYYRWYVKDGSTWRVAKDNDFVSGGEFDVKAVLVDNRYYRWDSMAGGAGDKNYHLSLKLPTNPVTVSARSLTYNGSAQELVSMSGGDANLMHYSLTGEPEASEDNKTIPSKTDCEDGGWTVYWLCEASDGKPEKKGSVHVTMNKAENSLRWTTQPNSSAEKGSVVTYAATGEGEITYKAGNSIITGGSYTVTGSVAISATASGDSNHKPKTISVQISVSTPSFYYGWGVAASLLNSLSVDEIKSQAKGSGSSTISPNKTVVNSAGQVIYFMCRDGYDVEPKITQNGATASVKWNTMSKTDENGNNYTVKFVVFATSNAIIETITYA